MGQTRINSQDIANGQVSLNDLGTLTEVGSLITYSAGSHVALPTGQSGAILTSTPSGTTGVVWTTTPVITQVMDPAGAVSLDFLAVAGAQNYLRIGNATTGADPAIISIAVAGASSNINIRFVPKGTGKVRIGSNDVVDTATSQSLSNKTLESPIINQPTIDTFVNSAHNHTDAANGGQIEVTSINAGGTLDNTTFLRGDGQWASPGSSSSIAPIMTISSFGGF